MFFDVTNGRGDHFKRPKYLYQLFPICRIKTHFITIDTMEFWGLCRDTNAVDCSIDTFQPLGLDHWKSLFEKKGSPKVFTGTVTSAQRTSRTVFVKRSKRYVNMTSKLLLSVIV